MQRVEANAEWSLFCPNEAAGLADVWGEEFEAMYLRYEKQGRAKKTIKAQQLWFAILEAQVCLCCQSNSAWLRRCQLSIVSYWITSSGIWCASLRHPERWMTSSLHPNLDEL